MTGSTLATLSVPQPAHGGSFRQGQPRIIVMHSIECPIERGRALTVAQSMARAANVSVHYLVDPGVIVHALDESLIGWGAGTVNSAAIHIEQTGYAAYSRAQWTTADGLAMLHLAGKLVADIAGRHGIPLRWLTDAQLLAAWKGQGPGGFTTHAQCARVIGGTTHTDPGSGYPTDLLLGYATPAATKPTPTPPEDDMPYTETQLRQFIREEVVAALSKDKLVAYSDQRLRPAAESKRSITDTLGRDSAYVSNASGGVDQLARAQGMEPEDRK